MKTSRLVLIYFVFLFSAIANAAVNFNSFNGNWIATTQYSSGNVVLYNSSTYISLVSNNRNKNPSSSPTAWQLIAVNSAAQGPQGPAGPQGATGNPGAAGKSYLQASAGDACTLNNSKVINTGVLAQYSFVIPPATTSSNHLVCENPNEWNFQQDMLLGLNTASSFRNWTLMSLPAGILPYDTTTFTQLNSFNSCTYDFNSPVQIPGSPVRLGATFNCWTNNGALDGSIGLLNAGLVKKSSLYSLNTWQLNDQDRIVLNPTNILGNSIRWTSPFTGSISLKFAMVNNAVIGGAMSHWEVIQNNQPILKNLDLVRSFPLNLNVTTGDTIDLVIERAAGTVSDLVDLDLIITKN